MTMTPEERADEITGGRPAEKVFAYRIAAAIRAAEQEAEQRGVEQEREACLDVVRGYTGQYERHRGPELYQAICVGIRARAKQQEPA